MAFKFDELRKSLGDDTAVLTPESCCAEQWQAAYHRWSALTERIPAAVVYPSTAECVSSVLKWAAKHRMPIAVKCGGNDNLPSSSVESGLVVDMRRINSIKLADDKSSLTVGGGCLWGEVYPVCDKANVSVVGGGSHAVGVGGYLTQAGWSWLVGLYGYACDSVISATIVLASGKIVTCDRKNEPDLFWAIRGGGANFGIATEFVLKTYPHVGGHLAGTLHYKPEDFPDVLELVKTFLTTRSAHQSIYLGFDCTPNNEPEVFILLWVRAESAEMARENLVMRPFWNDVKPVADYSVFCSTHEQSAHVGDAAEEASPSRIDGRGWNFAVELLFVPGFMEEMWKRFQSVVTTPDFEKSLFFFECHDLRKASTIPLSAAAFPAANRKPHIGLLAALKYSDPANDKKADAMLRDILKFVRTTAEKNSLDLLGTPTFLCCGDEPLEDVWLGQLPKLRACKTKYDPDCLLRSGFLIPPDTSTNIPSS